MNESKPNEGTPEKASSLHEMDGLAWQRVDADRRLKAARKALRAAISELECATAMSAEADLRYKMRSQPISVLDDK